jgi:hypothetical protein
MCGYDDKIQALAKALRPMVSFSNAEEATIVAYGWWKPDIGKTPEQIDSSRAVLDEKVSGIISLAEARPGSDLSTCLRAIEARPNNRERVLRSAVREALRLCAVAEASLLSA